MVKYDGIKVIRKYGDAYVIAMDKDIRKLLNISMGDFVRITVEKVDMTGEVDKDGVVR